jgi:FtsZ-binding cell division protein ZapB
MSANAVSTGRPDSDLPEDDSLSSLEERIKRTLDLVATLRSERDAAVAERDAAATDRDAAQKSVKSALAEAQTLRHEVEELRGERKQVRTRIEKLLGQMDQISR